MTQPLEILKAVLQKALSDSTESEDFKEALRDASYACNLSTKALEQFINSWILPSALTIDRELDDCDIRYVQGVQFVEGEWHKITGMF
jgi:hypothetical protein